MRLLIVLAVAALLTACGGSASVRAGGPGPTGTQVTAEGGSVHIGRGVALAVVIGVAVNDGFQWLAARLRQTFGTFAAEPRQLDAGRGCDPACAK